MKHDKDTELEFVCWVCGKIKVLDKPLSSTVHKPVCSKACKKKLKATKKRNILK
jgi:hypothetical protein